MGDEDDGFYPDGVEKAEWSGMKRRFARKMSVDELIKSADMTKAYSKDAIDPFDSDEAAELFEATSNYLEDESFARRFVECMEILRRKNADYSQNEQKQDRIAAFKRIARDAGINTRQAWAVFAQKHWGAIMRYVKDGFVESEPIHGRINDMINYLVLLGAIVDWEEMSGEI